MKIIAFYLPQFHNIPENDEWWGDGFTEWVNVKKAKPLFEGHEQPRIPLNNNYYNLLDDEVKIWQANLAKRYGIYGFCYYHYWFDGKLLLEKPMEQMLANSQINIPFCICWANEPWTKAWVGETKTLIPQKYGNKKEWKEHFDYLLPFFKDKRYILDEGKPLVVIYRPEIIEVLNEMLDYWKSLAIEAGFPGLKFAYQSAGMDEIPKEKRNDSRFDYDIEFQPAYAFTELNKNTLPLLRKLKKRVSDFVEKHTGKTVRFFGSGKIAALNRVDYDMAWQTILNTTPETDLRVPGAFVDWDNTPRHGDRGRVYVGKTPEKFTKYLTQQIVRAREVYHKDMIFMYAWNEWAEGGYLEPDEKNGYAYLEGIKKALDDTGENPWKEN